MRFELGKLELFGLDLSGALKRWWLHLGSLFPFSLADVFLRPRPRIRAVLQADQLEFVQIWPGPVHTLLQLGLDELEYMEDGRLHEQLVRNLSPRLLQLDVILPEQQVLRRRLGVPHKARFNLRQALAFQISRLTPFAPEQVYFDVQETSARGFSTARDGMLDVELQVAARAQADRWMTQIRRVTGLEVTRMQAPLAAADSAPERSADGNLLGQKAGPSHWWRRLNLNSLLIVLLCLCIALVVLAPVLKLRTLVLERKHEIVTLHPQIADLRDERYRLEQHQALLQHVLEQRQQRGSAAAVIEELSRIVPDGIFLSSLSVSRQQVEIRGSGSGVVELIDLLNASPFFIDAKFSSAVTRARSGLDVFTATMQLRTAGDDDGR